MGTVPWDVVQSIQPNVASERSWVEAAWLERASGKVPGGAAWLAVSGSNRGVRRELACVAASGSGDEGTLEWVEDGDGGGVTWAVCGCGTGPGVGGEGGVGWLG